jgi:hypothetical protein
LEREDPTDALPDKTPHTDHHPDETACAARGVVEK